MAGSLSASVGVRPDTVRIGGTFALAFNTTASPVSQRFRIGTSTTTVTLPAGPFVRVTGDDVFVEIGGQTLRGNFAFQQLAIDRGPDGIPGTSDDLKAVRLSASNVTLSFGDGAANFLSVTEGTGNFLILRAPNTAGVPSAPGIAGGIEATVRLNVPGVTLRGTLQVEVNNTGQAIDEVFFVGGLPIELQLEAGNFVRVAGSNVEVDVVGQTLKGNFEFERVTAAGQTFVQVTFDKVELGLGDGTAKFVRVTEAAGSFTLDRLGLGGEFDATVAVDAPGVSFGGMFHVILNTKTGTLNITGANLTLTIAGQAIGASSFTISQATAAGPDGVLGDLGDTVVDAAEKDNVNVVSIAIDDLTLKLGAPDDPFINVVTDDHLDGALLINNLGVAATFTGTATAHTFHLPAGLSVAPNPPATAISFRLEANTIAAAVDTSFELPTSPAPIRLDVPAGPFIRVVVEQVAFSISGGPTMTGSLFFDRGGRISFGDGTALPGGAAAHTTAVVAADVDQDGDLDLILGNDGSDNQVILNQGLQKNGGGELVRDTAGNTTWLGFSPTLQTIATGGTNATTSIAVGDLNGDGWVDVVFGNAAGQPVRVHLNNGLNSSRASGGFRRRRGIGEATDATNAVALADVDGDGDPDLVVGNGPERHHRPGEPALPQSRRDPGQPHLARLRHADGPGSRRQHHRVGVRRREQRQCARSHPRQPWAVQPGVH